MDGTSGLDQPRFRAYGRKHIERLPHVEELSRDQLIALKAVSAVLPFRVNDYVMNELIDWGDIPSDPIYQLTFPQAGMLEHHDFVRMQDLVVSGAGTDDLNRAAAAVHRRMNPHPGGQADLNVPAVNGRLLPGCQHKYRETVLFFPSAGQTCHAYCTYCFRWPQFVHMERQRFASHEVELLVEYLGAHLEVTDVLMTGGDPMIMSAKVLRRNVEPLLSPELDHLDTIRIGTKSLSYWPYRFTTDRDADEVLRLFEEVVSSGRQLALMAHFSHPRELHTATVCEAIRRIQNTGAVIRSQAPLIRHVNDDSDAWAQMWREQVQLGVVPYYMFVERDTGPRHYFEVPLARGLRIFDRAYAEVSGLARTVRGPSMSATPGKVLVEGISTIGNDKVFILKMIQGRDARWVNRVFFARFDSQAVWLDDLEPAFGDPEFFFERNMRELTDGTWLPEWQRDQNLVACEGA
jgi:KamA family protein